MRRRCKYFGYLRCLNCWFWASRRAICSSVLLIRFVVGFVSKLFVLGAVLPWADLMISIYKAIPTRVEALKRGDNKAYSNVYLLYHYRVYSLVNVLQSYDAHGIEFPIRSNMCEVRSKYKIHNWFWSNWLIQASKLILL